MAAVTRSAGRTLAAWYLLVALAPWGCSASGNSARGADAKCALIQTDDDIPSGSASAGALFVPDAALGKELLTRDVLAVARGFLDAGLCVVVLDPHDEAIDPVPLAKLGVEVVTPSNSRTWTWPFLGDVAARGSMAALVGFHSRDDQASGFRPHTINDQVRTLTLDGRSVGEVTHQILGLGAFDVPVVLVSGDMNATAEAAALIPTVEQVTVRWRDAGGNVAFLSGEEASLRLREAARRAAVGEHAPYRPPLPLRVGLRMGSKLAAQARAPTLAGEFQRLARERHWDLLGGFDLGATQQVDGSLVTWTAPNALAAYASISVAASYLRGPDNFEIVSRGYSAYQDGRYDEAIATYQQALAVNPYDMATRCRIGIVYQKMSRPVEALKWLREAVADEIEIGDAVMRSACWLGIAQAEFAQGSKGKAREAAQRVLALPDAFDRHQAAMKILAATPATED